MNLLLKPTSTSPNPSSLVSDIHWFLRLVAVSPISQRIRNNLENQSSWFIPYLPRIPCPRCWGHWWRRRRSEVYSWRIWIWMKRMFIQSLEGIGKSLWRGSRSWMAEPIEGMRLWCSYRMVSRNESWRIVAKSSKLVERERKREGVKSRNTVRKRLTWYRQNTSDRC